jgi:hypothetical protein
MDLLSEEYTIPYNLQDKALFRVLISKMQQNLILKSK